VPDAKGLRPTPDRVRETLFNWLAPWVPGARCIDLFAGTGALCLEALSRGAASVVMVEQGAQAATVLRANVSKLAAKNAEVVQADALAYLTGRAQAFDIVFVDPPFRSGLIEPVSELLESRGWLHRGTMIYVEAPARLDALPLPDTWERVRSGIAGQVGYHLFRKRR
jgi:16S rRNA (guanine966-N2)-methyltransferase